MKITVRPPQVAGDEWEAWIHLETGDPLRQNESFVIGLGMTGDEALANARTEIDAAFSALPQPDHAEARASQPVAGSPVRA